MATQSAPVLVTRPEAEGEAFAAALTGRFGARVQPLISPLLQPRNLHPDIADREYAAVVFTSAQAVAAARPLRPGLPSLAWCVGRRTAEAAEAAGFRAKSADGDAQALIKQLSLDPPDGSILYLRGVDTSVNILEKLKEIGLPAHEAIVYAQDPLPLSPDAIALLQTSADVILPLFSPRSAQIFRAALPSETHARLHVAAMSGNVADALADLPRAALTVARHPDLPSMLDAVETLLVGRGAP